MLTSKKISALVAEQLAQITDPVLAERIKELLVTPYAVDRKWDYGVEGQSFACWTLLEHQPSNTGIAYCAEGFGPGYPWGLVFMSGQHMNIGMDSGWYPTLDAAMRASMAWEGPNPEGYEIP
jgi:hypothetical protein